MGIFIFVKWAHRDRWVDHFHGPPCTLSHNSFGVGILVNISNDTAHKCHDQCKVKYMPEGEVFEALQTKHCWEQMCSQIGSLFKTDGLLCPVWLVKIG